MGLIFSLLWVKANAGVGIIPNIQIIMRLKRLIALAISFLILRN